MNCKLYITFFIVLLSCLLLQVCGIYYKYVIQGDISMNSLSNCNCDKKVPNHDQHDDCDNYCKHPLPGKALLRCNNGNFGTTNVSLLIPPFSQTFNQPIASVTIDTTCLYRKKILVDFAGILTSRLVVGLFTGTLIFTLFKTCKESRVRQSVITFTFNFLSLLSAPEDRALNFEYSYCEDQCDDCCTYTLEMTNISSETPTSVELSINGTLCVLAVE